MGNINALIYVNKYIDNEIVAIKSTFNIILVKNKPGILNVANIITIRADTKDIMEDIKPNRFIYIG
ncbi:hypothetical protein MYSEV_246 [Mythimna separata entomopoxvirus 'L']|uniref:Uncharacterized protein n=1 Tax=Mythimna separata entomopoxvirus 'L' TaxID=1293572 RepID=A0A916KQD3_9POXV|nr:hypothetical protein MYSEV_246 [Mythimna separata entomopoxvirus 'L']CCU56444.1 hypothetical protein MYSEV_246 [Mythimna separata entomopoxvirus 'L']